MPVITLFLLEFANISQLYTMWTTRTSAGQNPIGWISVNAALVLWLLWYLEFTPEKKLAIYATAVGICINAVVIVTTFYFQ